MSKFASAKWEPIHRCLESYSQADDFHIQLWDCPDLAVDQIRNVNPKWTVELHSDQSSNPQINIWNARRSLLQSFCESDVEFGLMIDDDIMLCGSLSEIPLRDGTLTILRRRRRPSDPWEIGYMESGIVLPREIARAILDDYSLGPVAHDDRFLILLAYLHGFHIQAVHSRLTCHLTQKDKNGHQSWTYTDKAADGLLPYGAFTKYVVPGVLGIPGRPTLNEEGIRIATLARERRTTRSSA